MDCEEKRGKGKYRERGKVKKKGMRKGRGKKKGRGSRRGRVTAVINRDIGVISLCFVP